MVVLLSVGYHDLPPTTSIVTAEFNTLEACHDAGSKLYLRVVPLTKDETRRDN